MFNDNNIQKLIKTRFEITLTHDLIKKFSKKIAL